MVETENFDEKINETKEKFDEKFDEKKEKFDEKFNEKKEKFDEKKEKGKIYTDKFVSDLSKSVDELKDNVRSFQKYADQKINEYKQATIGNLSADLIETKETYYLKVAVPGVGREEVDIEAGDNDIVISTTYKPFIEEFEEFEDIEDVKIISSELKSGKCSKVVRFENSIEKEKITAKYNVGIVIITIPKIIIPKHKVTVE